MTIIIILGITAFLVSVWALYGAYLVNKSVSEGSNFDEFWDKDSK